MNKMTQIRQPVATGLGTVAIASWGALALLTVIAGGMPPFQLLAMTTAWAFLIGSAFLLFSRQGMSSFRQPLLPWAVAVSAIFLDHALYFYALATVPPAHASLIAYFWPLLIVLLSAIAPGAPGLSVRHLAGATMGLLGVGFLLAGDGTDLSSQGAVSGYLAAACCAFVWSGYSVANRQFAAVPSNMLIGVCGVVSLLASAVHLATETTILPDPVQWGAILLLGIGPVGLAFLAWDFATKHGNLSLLGALAYFTPLLSTLLLVFSGHAEPTRWLALSVVLIVVGAIVAASGGQRGMAGPVTSS